jgi:signal transduction histidine kinase/ActR/RegA family two-component response regulator
MKSHSISTVEIIDEDDVVTARQRARQVAQLLAFDEQDQARISSAVSEIARTRMNRKKPGFVEFLLEGNTAPQVLVVYIGCSHLPVANTFTPTNDGESAAKQWESEVVSARRLMDRCDVRVDLAGGLAMWLTKRLSKCAPLFTDTMLERFAHQLAKQMPQNSVEEVRQQNWELVQALDALHERQQELIRLNRELEDTNRGVVALYSELDEKASHLKRTDDMKSRFLSNMSHEFRTPLNTILALTHLLLDRSDGDLTSEQEKQVGYIRKSGEDLLELVNDLLDLAKIEAGKIEVRPAEFDVGHLFSALRGMLRPLLMSMTVHLVFEGTEGVPPMKTDKGKVAQILRNLISNAMKFTERGEVRIAATLSENGRSVAFTVADTGIGIPEEDQARIFEEYSQLEHPIQRTVKGTGLGLPLCRMLAGMLGGTLTVASRPGVGSTFTALIPLVYAPTSADIGHAEPAEADPIWKPEEGRLPVLVVEDESETRVLYETYLRQTVFQPLWAATIREARGLLRLYPFRAIVLDALLPDEEVWEWLGEIKGHEATKQIPVLIVSSAEDSNKGLAFGADDYCIKPVRRDWLLERLQRFTATADVRSVEVPLMLIVDNQETDIVCRRATEEGWSASR